jgi:hypothetical protein
MLIRFLIGTSLCFIAGGSTIPTRLVPPFPDVNFLGRVEVLYNNTWGTICDDNIRSLSLAHIVCRAQNFSRALCGVPAGRLGPGEGETSTHDESACSNVIDGQGKGQGLGVAKH